MTSYVVSVLSLKPVIDFPLTVIAPAVYPDSSASIVIVMVWSIILVPDVGLNETDEMTGADSSNVTLEASVVAVTVIPAFPAVSENAIENAIAPGASPVSIVLVATQLSPLGFVRESGTFPSIVTVGEDMVSLEVNESVTRSFTVASVVSVLSDAMDTGDSVGATPSSAVIGPAETNVFPIKSSTLPGSSSTAGVSAGPNGVAAVIVTTPSVSEIGFST